MKRWAPLIALFVLTLLAIGGGAGASAVISRLVAPEPEALAALSGGTPSAGPNGVVEGPAPAAAAPAARARSERDYMNAIMGRNIFDPDAIALWNPKASGGGPTGSQPVSDLKVRLVGTLVAEPMAYSSCLIAEDGGETFGYNIGDKIQDAEIILIEDEQITIRRGDGKTEVLRMNDEAPKASARAPSTGGGEEVEALGDNRFTVDRATIDKYMGDLEGLSRLGRALLHRGPDGEFDGYRLSAIRRNTIADQLGIKNGDVVHTVNGQPLTSMQAAMNAYQTMMNDDSFSFEVTRRGQKMTLEYDIR